MVSQGLVQIANRRGRKKTNKSKKTDVSDYNEKQDAVSALENASSGLTFEQIVRGDGEKVCKGLCKRFASQHRRGVTVPISFRSLPKRLKVISLKLYGTETNTLSDSGAIPNVMKSDMTARLSLMPEYTSTKTAVANGQKTVCREALKSIPVRVGQGVTKQNFLVVIGSPVDLLIGYSTEEELQACLHLGKQSIRLIVDRKTETL